MQVPYLHENKENIESGKLPSANAESCPTSNSGAVSQSQPVLNAACAHFPFQQNASFQPQIQIQTSLYQSHESLPKDLGRDPETSVSAHFPIPHSFSFDVLNPGMITSDGLPLLPAASPRSCVRYFSARVVVGSAKDCKSSKDRISPESCALPCAAEPAKEDCLFAREETVEEETMDMELGALREVELARGEGPVPLDSPSGLSCSSAGSPAERCSNPVARTLLRGDDMVSSYIYMYIYNVHLISCSYLQLHVNISVKIKEKHI